MQTNPTETAAQKTPALAGIEMDLMLQLVALVDYDLNLRIELDGPEGLVGVWSDDDVIGCGESVSEALSDAILTVRGWQF